MIRVLLVDDHPIVRDGYQRLLEQDPEVTVVAHAASVDDAWLEYRRHRPDLTITDVSMPGSGGLELLRRLRQAYPDARVVVFTMYDSEMLMRRALSLGASAFVSKSAAPEQLVEAVRAVMDGRRYLDPALAPGAAARGEAGDALEALTDREVEILRLIASGESPTSCARALHLSPKTVSNLQSIIKDKLGVPTTAGLVRIAIRCGLAAPDVPQ